MASSTHQIQKTAYLLFIIVVVFWILKVGSFIIIPLVWGVFFAFSLFPISNWFEEKRIPRGLAITLTIVLISAVALLVFYTLINQVVNLILDIPEISDSFNKKISLYFADLGGKIGFEGMSIPEISDIFTPESLNTTLRETVKSLTLAGIIPLFIFLMLYYTDFFMEFLKKVSGNDNNSILNWIEDSGKVIQSYLVGMVIVTGIVSVMSGVVFYFLGIKYYLLFAVFIAVMNLIPYVGVILSSFLVVFYVLLTTDNLFYPFITLFMLWIIQLTENNLITPVIVGSKVKVNTMVVILAILIGGSLWGVSGMILFIPLMGVLKITFDRIPSLEPYGYLLGDKFPINEKNENFWKLFLKKVKNKKEA
jgi:predicted PurR-regulated permease PerM